MDCCIYKAYLYGNGDIYFAERLKQYLVFHEILLHTC